MISRVGATSHFRRVAVFVCLAALLLAVLTPAAAVLPLAILVTLWFSVAVIISAPLPQVDEQGYARQAVALLVFSPRPPPTL